MALAITSFSGQYRYLSNFYPVDIFFKGIVYPSVEHAYQAQKIMSPLLQKHIASCKTPGEAKRMGRQLQIREDWERIKIHCMSALIERKFDCDDYPDLVELLIGTYPVPLIEGNRWNDTFWGQCPVGNGENNLGKLLMLRRKELL